MEVVFPQDEVVDGPFQVHVCVVLMLSLELGVIIDSEDVVV